MPIDNDNICLRGSVIRNTKWMVGLVIFTGEDTKLQVSRSPRRLALFNSKEAETGLTVSRKTS